MFTNTKDAYAPLFKINHWLMAMIIIALIFVGIYMTGLPEEDPDRRGIYGLHKAMGALVFLLAMVRIAWIAASPTPALPASFDGKEKMIIKGIKIVLYFLMVMIPVSGYLMSTAKGYAVSFFGLFDLPKIMGKNEAIADFAHEMHEILPYIAILFILLHIAGAVKHRLQDKGGEKDILARMLQLRKAMP